MEIKIGSVTTMLKDESEGVERDLLLQTDNDTLNICINANNESNSFIILYKDQVEVLRDSLTLLLKNKVIKELEV